MKSMQKVTNSTFQPNCYACRKGPPMGVSLVTWSRQCTLKG